MKNAPVVVVAPEQKPAKKEKTGGRKKGTLNTRTLDLMSELERHHFEVVTEKLRVYKAAMAGAEEHSNFYNDLLDKLDKIGDGARVQINIRDPRPDFLKVAEASISDLMNYVFPKRSSVAITGPDGGPLTLSFTDLLRKADNE